MKICKSILKGSLFLPPSKSHSLRAILFAMLAKGKSIVKNPLFGSSDLESMIEACKLLGALITKNNNELIIDGIDLKINGSSDVIHAGNSGIVLRFLTALSAHSKKPIVITGDHSIRYQRPMKPLLDALKNLGAQAISTKGDGFAPIIVQGPIKKNKTHILGQDSQFVSSLLIMGMLSGLELEVECAGEKPWIDLTLDWLKKMNVSYLNDSYCHYKVDKIDTIHPFEYKVPGDLSTLSFPVAASLIGDFDLTIENVDLTDCQGDKKLLDLFAMMGAKYQIDAESLSLKVTKRELKGVDCDINDFIDALPILATVACFATSKTRIYNASIAKSKECNRIQAIAQELTKMGAHIIVEDDGLTIYPSILKSASLFSHNDHRIAMSLAIAAMNCQGQSFIKDISCISKTYPLFIEEFQRLGALIKPCR